MLRHDRLRFQLAVQGGGAKIVGLLAAAEHLQKLQRSGDIEITRIAGTSAGALVGALLAGAVDIATVVAVLREKGEAGLRELVPMNRPHRWWLWDDRLLATLLANLRQGKPLLNMAPLATYLNELFSAKGITHFSHLKEHSAVAYGEPGTEFQSIAANLRSQELAVHPEGSPDSTPLVPSLLDSCALPFVFRLHATGGHATVVDGGICENLPAEVLWGDDGKSVAEYGPVFALSFKPTTPRPDFASALDFAMGLLDTSINHSMNRARRRFKETTFDIQLDSVRTFDLGQAAATLSNGTYRAIVLDTEKWMSSWKQQAARKEGLPKAVLTNPWAGRKSEALMRGLGRICASQLDRRPLRLLEYVLEVRAYCLLAEDLGDRRRGSPDEVRRLITFEAVEGVPVDCIKLELSSGTTLGFVPNYQCDVFDRQKRAVPYVDVPVLMEGPAGGPTRALALHFTPPIEGALADEGPFELRFLDELMSSMSDLDTIGRDYMSINHGRASPSPFRAKLVLYVPDGYKELEMVAREGSPPGRPMTQAELADFNRPNGFRALGWQGEVGLPPVRFGVDFIAKGKDATP